MTPAILPVSPLALGLLLLSPAVGALFDNRRTDIQDVIIWDLDWSDVERSMQYNLYVIGATALNPSIDVYIPDSSHHHVKSGSYIVQQNYSPTRVLSMRLEKGIFLYKQKHFSNELSPLYPLGP